MKKLIYCGALAFLSIGFVACSGTEEELNEVLEEVEMTEEETISEETTEELNEALDLQEKAEQLEDELSEYLETL